MRIMFIFCLSNSVTRSFFLYFQDKEGKKKSRNKEGKIQFTILFVNYFSCKNELFVVYLNSKVNM